MEFLTAILRLLFNKVNVFAEELKHAPLTDWVPKYKGKTYDDACKYIEHRFTNLVKDKNRPLCITYISAVDGSSISGASKCFECSHYNGIVQWIQD
jgi:hypothetical protein